MVFEAIVVELLNKFLKQYVENLDTSQLKIGIWSGDVVLKDLAIKTTIFDDLNLPVRVKWGKLGKLSLKIPWKNLYGSQAIVNIEELLVVIVPNNEIFYDPVKEEKWAFDSKQAKLRIIEEVKKREMEKDKVKESDGFVEKLLTQIIKNLQLMIRNIHIRYEDKTTIPGSPFSVGVTMSNLSAQTTIDNPTAAFSELLKENDSFICKVVDLEGLSVYWNSSSALFADLPKDGIINALLNNIPTAHFKPQGYHYMFGPLSASAFMRINPKPEIDGSNFSIPKLFVTVQLKEIELGITHNQYCDLMAFIQDYQRLSAAAKFQKYRPVGIPVMGHAKEWWHFAYNAVAEDIKRRKREWAWENIRQHRRMCRKYSELFKQKMSLKKMAVSSLEELTQLEKKLNTFNLILLREQVYVEIERGQIEKVVKKPSSSWFSGWFGYDTEAKEDASEEELVKKIERVMTTQEKEKLYKAIGYEESAVPTNYPITFIQVLFSFHLDEIKMKVFDDRMGVHEPILSASIKTVKMNFEQRPAAVAIKLAVIIGNFQVLGKQDKTNSFPELVTSNCAESESLIEVLYETNPLGASCDQRLIFMARPLRIIYHAETINVVREVFTSSSTEDVNKIVAATSASLPTFQKITSLGLQYAIEKRTILEVKINIMSSYLIVPYGGVFQPGKEMLVLMLGKLNVETEENDQKEISVKKLYLEGTTEQDIFSTVLSASYTNFKCQLTGVQILFQLSGEDWVHASNIQGPSNLRFLESTNLEVTIKKSLVTDDARIPKMVVEGKLPSLAFNFSEERFVSFAALICSIPTKAEGSSEGPMKKEISTSAWSMQSISNQLESTLVHIQKDLSSVRPLEYVQGIDLVGHFEMNELAVNVSKTKDPSSDSSKKTTKDSKSKVEEQFLTLRAVKLEIDMMSKTFETINTLRLGGIEMTQQYKESRLPIVSTVGKDDFYLFVAEYVNLDTKVPDFYTGRGGIINRLTLNVMPLNVLLNKEAIVAELAFIANVQGRLDDVRGNYKLGRIADAGKPKDTIHEEGQEFLQPDKRVIARGKRFRKKSLQKAVIDFFLQGSFESIDFIIQVEEKDMAEFTLRGGSVEISTRKSSTNVDVKLKQIFLLDLNPHTLHKNIAGSLEEQTLSSRVTMYNSEYFGSEESVDMSVEAELGGIRCTFVHMFFARALEFLNAFQSQVEALKEGATVAAQRAKENVMKAYQNATRICLNIKITAPILIIPKKSTSLEALLLDLGVLTIKNSISELDYSQEGGNVGRPIIDTMKLHLTQLTVSRCELVENSEKLTNVKNFLIPVSFELTLKRNLSRTWFRVIPELEVLARLATIRVTLTHEDLCSIANILSENMGEGATQHSSPQHGHHHNEESKASKHKKELLEQHQMLLSEGPETSDEDSSNFTSIKFSFYMDSFVFDVVTEKKNGDTESGYEGLGRFVLETISLKGRMFSDSSIHTSVMLISCVLDDTRPGKEGRLTRLMERKVDTSSEAEGELNPINSMVEIIYQKKGADTFVDVRIFKFSLILSMDFLQKLGEFFTLEHTVPSPEVDTKSTKVALSKVTKEEEGMRPPTFTINLRLEKPDVTIVANMDSIDTDALVFHMELLLKYRVAAGRQVIASTVSDIELYSCCYNPAKRPCTLSQVIKPFTISIAGSTPEGQGLHVDICLTEIVIMINPSTVELISKCYDALLVDNSVSEKDAKEKVYSDLWDVEPFNPDDFWFLKPEVGVDALRAMNPSVSSSSFDGGSEEIGLLAIPSILVSLEGLSAKRTPLLLLEMGFQLQCYNWSSKMNIINTLTVHMQYYNKVLSAWEPLIEPVELTDKDGKHSYAPWELNCTVGFDGEGDLENVLPPKVSVNVTASDILQMTITKTCMEVLKNVVETYSSAVTKGVVQKITDLPPYIIKNETGLVVELLLEQSNLKVCKAMSEDYKMVKLVSSSEVELQDTSDAESAPGGLIRGRKETRLHIQLPISKNSTLELPLGMNSKRYYPIVVKELEKQGTWGLVSDVSIMDNTTTVVLQSILKVVNYFVEPINIHSLSEDGTQAEHVGVVEGNSSFSLPFHAVYSAQKKLFFSVNGYSLSSQSFEWVNIKKELNVSMLLQCNSKIPETKDPFFIQAVGEAEQIYFANSNRKTMSSICYNIHLQPTVKIWNSLPVDLIICFQGCAKEKLLHPGNNLQISNAEPGASSVTLRINDYLEKEWSCKEIFEENPSEFLIWKFVSYNGLAPESLNLGVYVTYKRKTAIYTVYCPYFMVNKTGHLLSYKFEGSSTVFYHPGDFKLPVMFSSSSKKFFGKKSAYLQVGQSERSEKFPVDVAGSGGTVECVDPAANITYKISVTITLSYNSLTRIVVFTPFYVFVNAADYTIECQEDDFPEEPWLEFPAGSCLPFWPKSPAKEKKIRMRPKGSHAVTPPFCYENTDTCLLRLSDKYGGIFVNVQATQAGTYITFNSYEPGQAPALILNHSEKVIKLFERGTDFSVQLKPLQKVMHSWVCPAGDRRLNLMNHKHMKDDILLDEDTEGLVFTATGESVRYVSFLDGTQRVLLFSDDRGLTNSLSTSLKVASGMEVICKLQGIGLSLVNNLTQVEIMYMGFVSSGIAWEYKKSGKSRYKSFNSEDSYKLEAAYAKYELDLDTKSKVEPIVEVSEKMKVNFEKMELLHPQKRSLRRTDEPGLWLAYRVLEDQVMLHTKINRIQIDNQLHDCIFPVVLSPVPPPKSVAYNGPKPFFELSILKIAADRSGVEQYKYFRILVQEFHVKIDIGFLQQIWTYLATEELSDEEQKTYFRKDIEFTMKPLISHVEIVSSTEQKNFYELLHFSPLKIHFSFSLAGNIDSGSLPRAFSVMLQSLGVTLTDVHDVIFRLSYFERKNAFLTNTQLSKEVTSHYYGQTIRQAYVLLLGLDVIGNPYGLIVGIGQGVEAFFYEPFQGIIQGPSDFAKGVAIGCKSLFGHTVGSTAGTLGKLTATLGKGLAVLSLDKEYQIQRMETQNRQENIQASMARGGRGIVMGVYDGVTGVVRKPIEGAKEEGVCGFFKGMGKGMMGLVTRPVTGIVDFASTSLNAVKRATEMGSENMRLRPPRYFRHDSLVLPFNLSEAKGNEIFHAISKRKYATTDKFEFSCYLKGKEVVVLTNKRLILAEFNELFGTWQEHLSISWKSMTGRPRCHTKGVAISMPQKSGAPKDKVEVKVLLIDDQTLREYLCKKMSDLYKTETEEQQH